MVNKLDNAPQNGRRNSGSVSRNRLGHQRRTSASDSRRTSVNSRTAARPTPRKRVASQQAGLHAQYQRNVSPKIFIVIAAIVIVVIATIGFSISNTQNSQTSNTDNAYRAGGAGSTVDQSGVAGTQVTGTTTDDITMTLGGSSNTIVLAGEEYLEAGCHAFDKTDGNITPRVVTSGTVDTHTPGTYTITYTATNSSNQAAVAERTVTVVESMDADTDGISVMMYHYVYQDDNPPEKPNANYVSQSLLEQQLKWLKDNDYYFPSYQELRAYVQNQHSLPAKSVVLTFDDAEQGFLDFGIPLLEQYQVPATSFVICDRENAEEKIRNYPSAYVSFQSHSYGLHNPGVSGKGRGGKIFDLTESEITADLQKAADMLGTNEAFAYPYGDVSNAAPAAINNAGILCAFTTEYGQVNPGDDPTQLKRMRVFGDSSDGSLSGFVYQVEHGAES